MKRSTLITLIVLWLGSYILVYQIGRTAGARDLRAVYKHR